MRLVSVLFDESDGRRRGLYARMAAAMERSAAENSPATPLAIIRADGEHDRVESIGAGAPNDERRLSLTANVRKIELWDEAVQAAKDGEVLGLLDCDTLILGNLAPVEAMAFDFAYTVRPAGSEYPFNAGVIFIRAGAAARRFFVRWRAENLRLLADSGAHVPLRARFGGINQAALGSILPTAGIDLLELSCVEWNCEFTTWGVFRPSGVTRVLHLAGRLRQACFGQRMVTPDLAPLVALWRRYDCAS